MLIHFGHIQWRNHSALATLYRVTSWGQTRQKSQSTFGQSLWPCHVCPFCQSWSLLPASSTGVWIAKKWNTYPGIQGKCVDLPCNLAKEEEEEDSPRKKVSHEKYFQKICVFFFPFTSAQKREGKLQKRKFYRYLGVILTGDVCLYRAFIRQWVFSIHFEHGAGKKYLWKVNLLIEKCELNFWCSFSLRVCSCRNEFMAIKVHLSKLEIVITSKKHLSPYLAPLHTRTLWKY